MGIFQIALFVLFIENNSALFQSIFVGVLIYIILNFIDRNNIFSVSHIIWEVTNRMLIEHNSPRLRHFFISLTTGTNYTDFYVLSLHNIPIFM